MDLLQHTNKLLELFPKFCEIVTYDKIVPYSSLYARKDSIYTKLFRDISNYKKLPREDRQKINNTILSLKEFLGKSVDYSILNLNDTANITHLLLQFNKLIAFNLGNQLNAGLRSYNSVADQDYKYILTVYQNFKSKHFYEQWNATVIKPGICYLDIFLHVLKILQYKPFKNYNVQVAFSWGWLVEKYCQYKYKFKFSNYLPWLHWVKQILETENFCEHSLDKCLTAYVNFAIDFTDTKLNEFRNYNTYFSAELNKRQLKVIRYLQKFDNISRADYVRLNKNISFMTAFRDLKSLVEKGILVVKGKGNKTRYYLNKSFNNSS